jgi:hypothetical protein
VINPELEEFRRQIDALKKHPLLRPHIRRDEVYLKKLTTDAVADLIRNDAAYYFLISAAGLNRTAVKRAAAEPAAQIVVASRRRAHVIKTRLPVRVSFSATAAKAVGMRSGDFGRMRRGEIEALFRDRLSSEGIPILMSPPVRPVPGVLIADRKPDGVYPDPRTGAAPRLYLEIKNVQRVADDIQKRLYEIAEAAIEMKTIYGQLQLTGLNVRHTGLVRGNSDLRGRIREQTTASEPVVVALFLCSKVEAERYRAGAEAFVDRIFFQEEIEDCLAFLKATVARFETEGR